MTILRRDLLAGSALVLLGASGCGNVKQNSGNANPNRLRTDFMADFTAKFIGDPTTIMDPAPPPATDPWPEPTRKWPKHGQSWNDAFTDYATFVNVLVAVFVGASPPSGLLADQIGTFLTDQKWPAGTPFPPEYKGEPLTVHLVEIAVIQDRLLQAINSFDFGHGMGAGPSNWPPH
jgi:hypothetical protein